MNKVIAHIQENIGRYVVVLAPFLTGLAALLGTAAADLGGVDTSVGRAVTAVATALGTAAAIATWLRNLGIWQIETQQQAVDLAVAGTEDVAAGSAVTPDVPETEGGLTGGRRVR